MTNEKRTPRGRPTGGEFAAHDRSDAEITLQDSHDWGSTGFTEQSRTPWGEVQWVTEVAPGITSVATAGHGGIKLSPQRNREIHASLRNSNGWYEEDCESHIVAMRFNEHFNYSEKSASDGVRRWFPDGWEAATGQKVESGQSRVRDEANFVERHKDDFISQRLRDAEDGTDRFIASTYLIGDEVAEYYISKAEVKAQRDNPEIGQENRILIDPNRHEKLPPKPKPALTPAKKFDLTSIAAPKTPAAAAKLEKDLAQRYRSSDGRVRSLGDEFAGGGITGKTAYLDGNGRRTYHLTQKENEEDSTLTVYQVSKSTFDLVGAPDARTPRHIAYQNLEIARTKPTGNLSWEERKRARERQDELKAIYDATPE